MIADNVVFVNLHFAIDAQDEPHIPGCDSDQCEEGSSHFAPALANAQPCKVSGEYRKDATQYDDRRIE